MENPEPCQKFKEFDILWTSIGICTAMNSKPNELIYEVFFYFLRAKLFDNFILFLGISMVEKI